MKSKRHTLTTDELNAVDGSIKAFLRVVGHPELSLESFEDLFEMNNLVETTQWSREAKEDMIKIISVRIWYFYDRQSHKATYRRIL